MKFLPKTLAAASGSALILALVAAVLPAQAQQNGQPAQQAQPPAAQQQVDETTVKAFAKASLDVQKVANRWSPRLKSAKGDEAEKLQRQANQEMIAAVQSDGLDVTIYNKVYQLAQDDPKLMNRIQQYRQQLQ